MVPYNNTMIPGERLARYNDFVDPHNTGAAYDPKKGLENLIGILSPDPKGVALAAVGSEWYGQEGQLQARINAWLGELGLSSEMWPIRPHATWGYFTAKNRAGIVVDGSLVELGAVIKKAEDPSQTLYSRSLAGTELAVPLIQRAVRFVSKAREHAEVQKSKGKEPQKFDSMWKIISSLNSPTDQRRPLAVWSTIDFLANSRGEYTREEIFTKLNIAEGRIGQVLASLGNSGVINYISPLKEVAGRRGHGWANYRLVDPQALPELDVITINHQASATRKRFTNPGLLSKIVAYVTENPNIEFESGFVAAKLNVKVNRVSEALSVLVDIGFLERPRPGFKSGEIESSASANDLTLLFNDLVCAPAKNVADTLSPLTLEPWNRLEVVTYLKNYNEERRDRGSQDEVDRLILDILMSGGPSMKMSHITDLCNAKLEREMRPGSMGSRLKNLVRSGRLIQPNWGYYGLPDTSDKPDN